jgi:hypothetical protein
VSRERSRNRVKGGACADTPTALATGEEEVCGDDPTSAPARRPVIVQGGHVAGDSRDFRLPRKGSSTGGYRGYARKSSRKVATCLAISAAFSRHGARSTWGVMRTRSVTAAASEMSAS